jgi:alanine racemase
VIYNTENLQEYIQRLDGKPLTIHLEIDTGMHRLGFGGFEILQALKLLSVTNIVVGSVFSHFSASEDENMDNFTHKQGKAFFQLAETVENSLGYSVRKHIANTSGIQRFPEYHGDRVRLGLGIYGLEPTGKEDTVLKPITALYAAISQIHRVNAGDGIGYGQLDKSEQDRDIATICIGYADGLSRRYGRGVGSVFVQGHFAPFVGNICMDMAMIDVTGINCREGDRVEIFGDNLTINEMARRGGTISYEILTSISQRVTRVFVGEH